MAHTIEELLSLFKGVGRDMFLSGLVAAGAGSLSVLLREDPDYLVITRRGANLGRLDNDDLVRVAIDHNEHDAPPTGNELAVHRAILVQGNGFSVVYARPPHSIALSNYFEQLEPHDGEGRRLLGTVPVVDPGDADEPAHAAHFVAAAVNSSAAGLAVLRGWGVFATADSLAGAYQRISWLEHSSRIITADLALRGLRHQESL